MSQYDREAVEALLPAVFDLECAWGMSPKYAPDPTMPKAKALKSQSNTLWAHLADIRRAWRYAPLSETEARAVLLCGCMDYQFTDAGRVMSVDRRTVQRSFERGVGRLVDFLNGTRFAEVEVDSAISQDYGED